MSKIRTIKATELQPDSANANAGTERGLRMLDDSLRQHGAGRSILVDKNGRVIAGNKTLERAVDVGLEDVILVPTDGTKLVAVQRTDLDLESDPAARLLAYRDNRVAEVDLAWDVDQLLADTQAGLDFAGIFDTSELDALLKQVAPPSGLQPGADPDTIPENVETRAKPGDLWRLAPHFLRVSDCRELPQDDADTILFDPPYDEPGAYGWVPEARKGRTLILMADAFRVGDAIMAAVSTGWPFRFELVWDGLTSWYVPGRPLARHKVALLFGEFDWDFDNALYPVADDDRRAGTVSNPRGSYHYTPDPRGKHLATVYPSGNVSQEGDHAHAKPVDWVSAILAGVRAESVWDMCCGSGTSLIAAERVGARVCANEIDPGAADTAIARWEAASGQAAERVE